jgi:tetratricopeptide (TPR) repeat protein
MRGIWQRYLVRLCITLYLTCTTLELARGSAPQTDQGPSPVGKIVAALRSQNFDEALRLCSVALDKSPKDKRVWTLCGMAYSGKEEESSALEAYQRALKLDSDYLPALEGAAQIEYQRRSPAAKPLILRVLAQRPDDPTSHTMLGFLEYEAKDCTDAVSHFQQGEEVLAKEPMALAAYGACLAQLGHYDQAIPDFERALETDPSIQSLRFNLALAQWKANQPQEALSTLQPLIATGNGHDDALRLSADIYESIGDTQHAVELLRKAILANPKNADAYLDFASLSYDHASMQVGIDILNAGLTQLPMEGSLYLARGVLYAQLGEYEQATEDFEKANHLDPNLSVLGAAKGIEASQQHKSAEALATFRAAAKAHPQDALTLYLLAEALSQESPQEGSSDYAEEVNAAKLACRLTPWMVAAHDLLATIYLQGGHTELAVEQSRAALAVDPKDEQAVYHLILALRTTGKKDEISTLLKQLAALRSAAQTDLAQTKRYQLQEMPVAEPDH